jgi:hypothetical protein
VPKREKEKMREEMRRDTVRSQLEQLAMELADEGAMMESLERGWNELGQELAQVQEIKGKKEEGEGEEALDLDKMMNAERLCAAAKAIVRFAGRLAGFRLLRREDRAQLVKASPHQTRQFNRRANYPFHKHFSTNFNIGNKFKFK